MNIQVRKVSCLSKAATDGVAVCDPLDMSPNAIRTYIVHWEEKRLSGEKP
jgi:hypothetical protein